MIENAYLFVHRTAKGRLNVPEELDLLLSTPAGDLYVRGDPSYRHVERYGSKILFRFGHPFVSTDEPLENSGSAGFTTEIECDETHPDVTIIADRTSLKPVFYCQDTCCVSNSPSLLADVVGADSVNTSALGFSLVYGFFPSGHTVFYGVRKLEGSKARVLPSGELIVEETKSVSTPFEAATGGLTGEDEYINRLHELIFAACKRNVLPGQEKVAVLLGGFDSALVASVLVRLGYQVKTFSFFYEDSKYNQRHVETLVRDLGIEHEWVRVDSGVLKRGFSDYRNNFFQPTNWSNYVIQSLHLVRLIRKQGYQVCFTGDGCDGLFQGYPGVFKSAHIYRKASRFLGKSGHILLRLINRDWIEAHTGHVYRLTARVLRNSVLDDPERTYLMYRIFDETSLARLFDADLGELESHTRSLAKEVCGAIPRMSTAKLAYAGRSNMGPNRLKLNACADATGIKIYSPYMDPALRKFVAGMPEVMLRPRGSGQDIGKYVLTKMASDFDLLSNDIIYQPKMAAVYAPVDAWLLNDVGEDVSRCINAFPIKVNQEYVKSLVQDNVIQSAYRRFVSSDSITSHAVSLLYTTALFFCGQQR